MFLVFVLFSCNGGLLSITVIGRNVIHGPWSYMFSLMLELMLIVRILFSFHSHGLWLICRIICHNYYYKFALFV